MNCNELEKMIAVVACAMTLTSVIAGCRQDTSKEASKDTSSTEIVAYGVIDPQISAQQIIADKKVILKKKD